MLLMDREDLHLHLVEQPATLSDDKDTDLGHLEFLVRRRLQLAVEGDDRKLRRESISGLYVIASSAGLTTDVLNSWYEDALRKMKRARGFSDEIEYATSAVTGERVQVWPPAPEDIVALSHETIRHAIRAINVIDPQHPVQ